MKRKLGIPSECLIGKSSVDNLDRIKDHGFEAFFSGRYQIHETVALKEKAEKLGLSFDFIHGPFGNINDFWTQEFPEIFQKLKTSVDGAAAAEVETVIVHVSSGWTPPPVCDVGLRNFDTLVDYAEEKGVKLAFENLRKLGNLACLLERYENRPSVGFCYDCGHEHCYTAIVPFLDFYGERVLCTHIHDNFGRDFSDPTANGDIHLLPFDGNIDFTRMMRGLDKANFTGTLMLEVHNKNYAEWTDDTFLKEAFARIERISKL